MALLQAYTVLVFIPFVCASLPSLNDTCQSIHTLDSSDSPSSNHTRTLRDIILSCGLTLFACTWTAIHTNIPGMEEGRIPITSRRVFLMVVALIAPELMITWATRQFFSARGAAKNLNNKFGAQRAQTHGRDRDTSEDTAIFLRDIRGSSSPPSPAVFKEWTMTHGFFAWMGGFMLYVDDKPRATLTPYELLHFVRDGFVDMPRISEAEIEDRSKGDGLSKAIALLQLAWFVVQLVARYGQNLPITLLEIDTLAVAALTCITYGLWWKKPKDVGCPYIVHWKARTPPSDLAYEKADSDFSETRFFQYIIYPFVSLMGVDTAISLSAARSRRVPSLGGYGQYNSKIVLLVGCFSGMVFGGIHCLGWNYLFQRHAEHMSWRAASLGIACAPVLLLFDIGYFIQTKDVGYFAFRSIRLIGSISSLIYIVARIILIVLMILSLRSLPLGVYDTVAWTRYIPHFNM